MRLHYPKVWATGLAYRVPWNSALPPVTASVAVCVVICVDTPGTSGHSKVCPRRKEGRKEWAMITNLEIGPFQNRCFNLTLNLFRLIQSPQVASNVDFWGSPLPPAPSEASHQWTAGLDEREQGGQPGCGVLTWAVCSQSGSLCWGPITQPLSTQVCRREKRGVQAGSWGPHSTGVKQRKTFS